MAVVAYLRVSTEKQFLENQREEIIRFAEKNALEAEAAKWRAGDDGGMARGIDGRSPEYAAGRLPAIKKYAGRYTRHISPVALRLPGRRKHKPTDATLPLPGASRSAPESKYPRLFVPAAP